jgi:hypothetical protein
MRTFLVIAAATALLAAAPGLAAADDPAPAAPVAEAVDGYVPPPCDDPDVATLAAASPECTGDEPVPSVDPSYGEDPPTVQSLAATAAAVEASMPSPADLPQYCREHVNAYFYSETDWVRLAQRLLANASPCVDYWISIPPLAADKTAPRCLQDDLVRALGPRVHVMAELHFAGWNKWWNTPAVPPRTPADAGREFVRKWRECGYLQEGETWALNEMHSGIRRNVPGARDNMIQFLDAVREASGVPGVAWVIGVGQQTTNVSDYKPQLQEWLQDTHFWTAMDHDLDVWGQEAYPDMRYWGVGDASRHARTTNVSVYLEHPLLLAENAPPTAATALQFLERTYVPLASDAWPYTSGFGYTNYSNVEMQRFVSEQTFAVKHFSQSRPHLAPGAKIAFAWALNNTCGGKSCIDPKLFAELTLPIVDRTASAIRESYELGGGNQMGACGEPGDHVWCTTDIPQAAFNPLWLTFPTW